MDEKQLTNLVNDMLPLKGREEQDDEANNFSLHESSGPTPPRLQSSTDPENQDNQSEGEAESEQDEEISEEEASEDTDAPDSPESPTFGE